jgi:hypothetical protein
MSPIFNLYSFSATDEINRSETVVCDDMNEKLIALATICGFATVNKYTIKTDMLRSKIIQHEFFSMECSAQ